MAKKKRVNPNRIPVTLTKADLDHVVADVYYEATTSAIAIMFTALLDKHGWTPEMLQQLWAEVNKLSEEVIEGRIKVDDLKQVLSEEYSVTIT